MEIDFSVNILYPEIPVEGIKSELLIESYDSFKNDIICLICMDIVNAPEQCQTCLSIFCKGCIKKWLESNLKCPTSRCNYRPQKLNLTALKLLSKIKLKCENGCGSIIFYEDYLIHVHRDCKLTKIKCRGCDIEIANNLINDHLNYCPWIIISCELCEKIFFREDSNEHKKSCPEVETKCQYCIKSLKRKDLEDHEEKCFNLVCNNCKFAFSLASVSRAVKKEITNYRKEVDGLKNEIELKQKIQENEKNSFKDLKKENDELKQKIREYVENLCLHENLLSENQNLKERIRKYKEKLSVNKNLKNENEELKQKVRNFEKKNIIKKKYLLRSSKRKPAGDLMKLSSKR
jgi:hypothetical protein